MSERYEAMIIWARDQIIPRLNNLDPPDISRFMTIGWDGLTQPYQDVVLSVFRDALEKEKYELSYHQTCRAIYQAFQVKGWVE